MSKSVREFRPLVSRRSKKHFSNLAAHRRASLADLRAAEGMMFFDKLIELIQANTKIGFALAFAAAAIFIGHYHNQWPFTLLQEHLGYVLFGGLIGAAVLLFQSLRMLGLLFLRAHHAYRLWFRNWTVMNRL